MEPSAGSPTTLSRAFSGLAACVLASVPLAIVYSLHGYIVSDEEHALAEMVLGTAVVVVFALAIATACGLVLGIPVYVLAARTSAPRALVLIVAAALAGVLVHELLMGGEPFELIDSLTLFAFFGAYSGAAFWLGAEVWARR